LGEVHLNFAGTANRIIKKGKTKEKRKRKEIKNVCRLCANYLKKNVRRLEIVGFSIYNHLYNNK